MNIISIIFVALLLFFIYGKLEEIRFAISQADRNKNEELRKIRKAIEAINEEKPQDLKEALPENKEGDNTNDTD